MATKPKAGQPYWTYVVGAIVGLGGLAWAVISNFVPKPEPAKPAVAAPANTPAQRQRHRRRQHWRRHDEAGDDYRRRHGARIARQRHQVGPGVKSLLARKLLCLVGTAAAIGSAMAADVSVSGSGSVGVGQMSGGTIQMGLSPQEARALATATGQELTKQLEAIVQRLNARQGAQPKEQDFSLGVVQSFLATIKGKQVPQTEWPAVFGELSRQYLQLGARIEATPVTSDRIKDLVDQADSARKLGKFDEADKLLAQAGDIAIQDAQSNSSRHASRRDRPQAARVARIACLRTPGPGSGCSPFGAGL